MADVDPISRLAENPAAALSLGISLILHDWQDLSLAVREGLGGPESDEKRDWLCSHIADMAALPEPKQGSTDPTQATTVPDDADLTDDLADTLEGALADEFATTVEDDRAVLDIARRVVLLRRRLADADRAVLTDVYNRYQAWQGQKKDTVRVSISSDSEESESDDENGDDVENKNTENEKVGPAVDQDGFTLVQRRR